MRPISLLGLLTLAPLACTPTRGPELEHEAPAQTSATTEAASPSASAESTSSPLPAPAPLVPEGPAIPGFAIYTPEQTFVIALDGAAAVIGEGLWVQDDRSSPPALLHHLIVSQARAKAMNLPGCACLSLESACELEHPELRRFDPHTGAPIEVSSTCACVRQHEPMGFPAMEYDGEAYEACAGGDEHGISAIVGGRLFYQGWEWNGACHEALSIYDAASWTVQLVDDPPEVSTSEGLRRLGCDAELGPAFVQRPWPIDRAALTRDCEDYFESEVLMLRRGELWAVRDDISGVHGIRHFLRRDARPERCPSVNDPCGDPEPFRDRAKLDRRSREFWIATDGGLALTAEGRRYSLWAADSDAPVIELELPNAHATDEVLGVRAHADVRPLRAVIAKHPEIGVEPAERAPTIVEPEQCRAGHLSPDEQRSARELGNECFELIGIELWSEAEAACLHGLARTSDASTLGAIFYNLGRIAEAQDADEQAAAHYRASLAARPGNRTVERRLARLGVPESRE